MFVPIPKLSGATIRHSWANSNLSSRSQKCF